MVGMPSFFVFGCVTSCVAHSFASALLVYNLPHLSVLLKAFRTADLRFYLHFAKRWRRRVGAALVFALAMPMSGDSEVYSTWA